MLKQGASFSEWQAAILENKINAMCADARVALEATGYDERTVLKVIDSDEPNPWHTHVSVVIRQHILVIYISNIMSEMPTICYIIIVIDGA